MLARLLVLGVRCCWLFWKLRKQLRGLCGLVAEGGEGALEDHGLKVVGLIMLILDDLIGEFGEVA